MAEENKSLAEVLAESGIKIDPEAMKQLMEATESMISAMNGFAQKFNEGGAELIKTKPLVLAKLLPAGFNIQTKKTKYNLKFKTRVQELAITCAYDYNTVYRVCSIFGIKKATDILNTCYNEQIQYLLTRFIDFPYQMTPYEEIDTRAKFKYIDPELPELFDRLLESSEYSSETLYWVFMAHGKGANDIVRYAIENELMPYQLLQYSEKKSSESAEEAWKKLRAYEKSMSKEVKLPKKLRNGW